MLFDYNGPVKVFRPFLLLTVKYSIMLMCPLTAVVMFSSFAGTILCAFCQLLGQSSSVVTKASTKTCRNPKTPLNVPTINSYRRLNGVKSVSSFFRYSC